MKRKIKEKKKKKESNVWARTRGIYYTETSNLRLCSLRIRENQCHMLFIIQYFSQNTGMNL